MGEQEPNTDIDDAWSIFEGAVHLVSVLNQARLISLPLIKELVQADADLETVTGPSFIAAWPGQT